MKFEKHLLPFKLVRRDVFHKNDRKESQLYLKELTLWYIRLNIYVWKTKFTSHKQYLFDLLFSRNAKKTHIDQSILHSFLLCLKINVSQTFRSSSAETSFASVHVSDTTCFDEYYLFRSSRSESVLIKRCSEDMQQIYRRTPMPKCDLNKVAKQLY